MKSGALKHIFLVGGCDGARAGRNYYTEFVKKTPADTAVLTLACGKYRFNDLDLGTIGGLPGRRPVGRNPGTAEGLPEHQRGSGLYHDQLAGRQRGHLGL